MAEEKKEGSSYKSVSKLEKEWFNKVNSYLFKDGKGESVLDINPETYLGSIREYNLRYQKDYENQDGAFKINDIWLTVPPDNISVQTSNNVIDLEVLRTRSSIQIDTGHGEIQVSVKILFADNPIYNITLEDELKYKLAPLMREMKVIPFCTVRNEYLSKRILNLILNASTSSDGKIKEQDSAELNDLSSNVDIMLTYQGHRISTMTESSRIVVLELNFLLFNYTAYMDRILYPVSYRKKDGILDRGADNKTFCNAYTINPEYSLPFYEFYALEFKEMEAVNDYVHRSFYRNTESGEHILFNMLYYDYLAVDSSLVSDRFKVIVNKNSKGDTRVASTETRASVTRSTVSGLKAATGGKGSISGNGSRFDLKRMHPILHVVKPHKGIDIQVPTGTPIFATHTGTVTIENQPKGAGLYITVTAGNGKLNTQYMHLSQVASGIKNGSVVSKGQGIALSGSSGGSTGPHLHYQINHRSDTSKAWEAVDPEKVSDITVLAGQNEDVKVQSQAQAKADSGYEVIPIKPGEILKGLNLINPMENQPVVIQTDFNRYDRHPSTSQSVTAKDNTTPSSYGNKQAPAEAPVSKGPNDPTNVKDSYVLARPSRNFTASEQKQMAFIEKLAEIPGVQFLILEQSASVTYIRIPQYIPVFKREMVKDEITGKEYLKTYGIDIVLLEGTGGIDVPRIPLSGSRFATHQFMGGRVDKLSLHISVTDEGGDFELRKIQTILNKVSDNALKYKAIASLDGVKIQDDGFINYMLDADTFSLSGLSAETHPNVPGGSMVALTLTDMTGAKRQAEKTLDFEQVQRQTSANNNYSKSFMQELLSKNLLNIQMYSNEDDKPEKKNREDFLKNPTEKAKFASFKITLKEHKDDQVLIDVFNYLADILNKAKFDFKTIYTDSYGFNKYVTSTKEGYYIKTDKVGVSSLYEYALRKWVTEKRPYLRDYKFSDGTYLFKQLKEDFPEERLAETSEYIMPAYLDFNLPPSINPDYYFYQSSKNGFYNNPHDISESAIVESTNRYTEYSEMLMARDGKPIPAIESIHGTLSSGSDGSAKDKAEDFQPQHDTQAVAFNTVTSVSAWKEKKGQLNQISGGIGKGKEHTYPVKDEEKLCYVDDGSEESGKKYVKLMMDAMRANNKVSLLDFSRAFPVYKLFIIEEDETELLAPFRQDFNDMFGLNAIQEIRVVQHSDQPADLMTVKFIDMTGKFSSMKYKKYAHQENKSKENIDTAKENPLKGIILQEGTAVQLRAGYSNNLNELETVFNGIIVGIDGNLNEYEMMCQSYGIELVQETKNPTEAKDICSWNAETKEVLQWCLDQPECKHLGKWKYMDKSNYQFSDSSDSLSSWLYYTRIRPDNSKQLSWKWFKDPNEINILAPDEGSFEQFSQAWANTMHDPWGTVWTVGTSLSGILKFAGQVWGTSYFVHNTTIWQIVDEMTYRYPGYVAKVLPFADRATLYYGPPTGSYFYRPFTMLEQDRVSVLTNELKDITKGQEDQYDKISYELVGLNSVLAANEFAANDPKNSESVREERRQVVLQLKKSMKDKDMLKDYALAAKQWNIKMRTIAKTNDIRFASAKPFRSYHAVISDRNLVSNKIKADYRDVATQVTLQWRKQINEVASDIITLKMNDFLEEEDVRDTCVSFNNCNSIYSAFDYAAHHLHREAKKLYKGSITLLGNPKIKPYDYVYIMDAGNQTYGSVEVAQHVFSIAPGEGMLSEFEPRMINHIRNLVSMTMMDAWDYLSAGNAGVETMDSAGGGLRSLIGTEQGQGQLVTSLLTLGTGGSMAYGAYGVASGMLASGVGLAALSVIAAPVIALMFAKLAYQVLLAAKYRNPIILHPIIKYGVPYIYGLDTYKQAGLMAWYKEKLTLLSQDVTAFGDAVAQIPDFEESNWIVKTAAGGTKFGIATYTDFNKWGINFAKNVMIKD